LKRILLVRHGESEWNSARRLQGQADIALSGKGRSQAVSLRPTVAGLLPDRVLTSDLKRAHDTAGLLGFPEATPTAMLREIDVGEWTGASIAELLARSEAEYRDWRAGAYTPPGGEHWSAFADRTAAAVGASLQEGAERLLVVCHGGVIRALLDRLVGLSPQRMVPVGPASLSIVAIRGPDRSDARLELLNYRPDGPVLDAPD